MLTDVARFTNISKAMIKQLSRKKYAALLCETVEKYPYPTVTYDFVKGKEICHGSMYGVEKCIHDLLYSACLSDIKDGLSQILYWGYYNDPRWKNTRANNFNKIPNVNIKHKLKNFKTLARKIKDAKNNNQILPGKELLLKIKAIEIPQFTSGISFASKILMFLDPKNYPILDRKIANKIMNLCFSSCFPPMHGLKFESIKISSDSARAYETWACWCREIADDVNNILESTRDEIRAVDVERAFFTLANSKDPDAPEKMRMLLVRPKKSWFRLIVDMFRA